MRVTYRVVHHISIHALRKESDHANVGGHVVLDISIHALRKESDPMMAIPRLAVRYFNPRSP